MITTYLEKIPANIRAAFYQEACMITTYLEKIPANIRAAFYQAPLFIHWIIALSWETNPDTLRAARRSMLISIFFLVEITLLYVGTEFVLGLIPGLKIAIQYTLFLVHACSSLIYVLFSLFLAVKEYMSQPQALPRLDQAVNKFEEIAGF